MRITRRQLRELIREALKSEGLFEAKRSRHPKMRPGPLPDTSETFTPQFVTLPAGFRMFHGSPHGGKITLPTGPSWFAPERETAVFHSPEAWSKVAGGLPKDKDKSPRVIKYRVKREFTLPLGEWEDLTPILAHYGAKAGIGDESLIRRGIEYFGWSSGRSWGPLDNLSERDIEELKVDQATIDATRELSSRFDGIVSFLRYVCENSDFEGWVANYEDGGSEVMLCNPEKHLRKSARQPVYRSKREKKWHGVDPEEVEEDEKTKAFFAKRDAERAAEAAAEELATTNKEIVFGHFFPDTWDKPDYSDPNVRSIIQNWQDHVSQEELEGISGAFSPAQGRQIKRGELRDMILQEIENTLEGKKASKSKGKPYKGSRRGKTESQAQQMAAGIALRAREKHGKKGAIKKLKGASKSMAAMSMKDLRKLATIRRGSEVPDSTKKGKERAALPGHIKKKRRKKKK